jgi:HTH-type transcriptional regulator/antitoxin HigA
MDNVRPLRNEADYDWAVAEVEAYFIDPPVPGTPDAERFDLLCDLIDAYDAKYHPLPDADPIDILLSFMQDRGWKTKDLAEIIGQKSKASEVLNRRRPLSLAMIQKIASAWGISADLLVKPYHLEPDNSSRLRPTG